MWEPNPNWTPWRAKRVEIWPTLFAHWKRWRQPYLQFGPIGSVRKYRYATDEELAHIKLEERFGEARSETTTPMSSGA